MRTSGERTDIPCILETKLAAAVSLLEQRDWIDADELPLLGDVVECRSVIVRKAVRTYDDYFKADVLDFSATREGYRLVVGAMLCALLHLTTETLTIKLANAKSTIDLLRIRRPNARHADLGLRVDRRSFTLTVSRAEALEELIAIAPQQKPRFLLIDDDSSNSARSWENRHCVRVEATEKASILLVSALMDYIRHGEAERELALFGSPRTGAESLGPGSAEVRFWLPGGFGWPEWVHGDMQ